MFGAILGRLAPYLGILLLASLGVNWLLTHELLASERNAGAAQQSIRTQAVEDALAGSQAARKGQAKADAGTISQLYGALGQEAKAAAHYQAQLNALQAANLATSRSIDHDITLTPAAQAWGLEPIPSAVLDDVGLCWWTAAAGWGTACDGPAGALGADTGGGHGPLQ